MTICVFEKKKDICIEFEYKSIQNCIHLQIFWAPHIYLSRTDVAVLEKKSMPPKTAPKGKAKAKPGNIFMYVYVCINLHVCVCVRIYLNLNLYIYIHHRTESQSLDLEETGEESRRGKGTRR